MGITHLSGLQVGGVPTMGMGGLQPFTGRWYFVDPAHGSDGNEGTADSPLATIYRAYALCRDGYNDVVALVGNGQASGSARMSVALAASVDPTATTGTITWAKNACHLVGIGAPGVNSRVRIAPAANYTAATFGNSGNMFNVTAQGCVFQNFSIYGGFTTGATGCITWIDAGGRNFYNGVDFLGLNDAASAGDTASRSLKVSGSTGEHLFVGCMIGDDTTTRSVANFSLELASGSPRNKFIDCLFPSMVSNAGASPVQVSANGIDRWVLFKGCQFLNATLGGPGSTTITDVIANNASTGGVVMLQQSTAIGFTGIATTASTVVTSDPGPAATNAGTIATAVNA